MRSNLVGAYLLHVLTVEALLPSLACYTQASMSLLHATGVAVGAPGPVGPTGPQGIQGPVSPGKETC